MGSLLEQIGKEIERNAKHKTPESSVANILTQALNALLDARGAPPGAGKQKTSLPIGSLESLAAAKPASKRVWNCTAADDCPKPCEFGWAILKPIVCEDHQEEGMEKYVAKRRCGQGRACQKQPTFGWHGKSAVSLKKTTVYTTIAGCGGRLCLQGKSRLPRATQLSFDSSI
jgi:hypothetical protein